MGCHICKVGVVDDEDVPTEWIRPFDWFAFDEYFESLPDDDAKSELCRFFEESTPEEAMEHLEDYDAIEFFRPSISEVDFRGKCVLWKFFVSPRGSMTGTILLKRSLLWLVRCLDYLNWFKLHSLDLREVSGKTVEIARFSESWCRDAIFSPRNPSQELFPVV